MSLTHEDLQRIDGLLLGWQREALRRGPAKEEPPAYGWSHNEEDWEGGHFHDRESARLEALDRAIGDGLEAGAAYYTARCKPVQVPRLACWREAGILLDGAAEQLGEEICGAVLGDWPDVSEAQIEDLAGELDALLRGWLAVHCPAEFWEPDEIQEHRVTPEEVASAE